MSFTPFVNERFKLLQKITAELEEILEKYEKQYNLSDDEIIQILEALKENYEWED